MSHRLGRGLLAWIVIFTQLPPACLAETPTVETEKSRTSTNVGDRDIQNLPVHRSYADLASLVPGIAANKASTADFVNWSHTPMPENIAESVQEIDPSCLQQNSILSSPYRPEYGRSMDGISNGITRRGSNELKGFSRYYLEDLARSREWPGESMGANGMLIGTGTARGKERVAVLYDDRGYPVASFNADDLKNHPEQVQAKLDSLCNLISSGKIHVSGKTTFGKTVVDSFPRSNAYGGYSFPQDYRMEGGWKDAMGGGMQPIEAPPTTPIGNTPGVQGAGNQPQQPSSSQGSTSAVSGSGVVDDQKIIDATNKQKNQRVKDAINQYLTPQGGQQQQQSPQSGSKPRSRLLLPRRWLAAIAEFLIQSAYAATTRASTTDANGNTVTIEKNPDGTTTRTISDAQGNVLERAPITPEPVTHAAPREGGTSASMKDADGNTITLKKQPDGATTRTVTDPSGNIIQQGPLPKPEPTKVPPRKPGTLSASTTDENGRTTIIERNPDGSVTRTVTDAGGKVIESGPLTLPPPTKPQPREAGAPFASATDGNGNVITLQKAPDGTTIQTITGPAGNVISQGPLTPPPVTKPAPRKPGISASATDADGNTITVEKQPGGPAIRTITAPDGSIIERTVNGQPAMPQAPPVQKSVAALSQTATVTPPQAPTVQTAPNPPNAAQTSQPATPQPSSQSTTPGYGLSYKPFLGLTPSLQYSYSTPSHYDKEPEPKEPFVPFIESGIVLGDTVYSNLGVYKVGEHPILDRKKKRPANASTSNSLLNQLPIGAQPSVLHEARDYDMTLGGSQKSVTSAPSGFGTSFNYYPPRRIFTAPQGWTPQYVGILPRGCVSSDKAAVMQDIRNALNGKLPSYSRAFWEPVYPRMIQGRQESAPAEATVPNDPLYARGSSAGQAAMKLPPAPKERPGGPDMSMAAPPEAGPSPMAEFGLRDRAKKGPEALDQWGLFATGFTPQGQGRSAWDLVDTSKPNTIVAVIDSGLDLAHPDGPQYLWTNPGEKPGNGVDDDQDGYVDDEHGWNFNDGNNDLTDYKGHGTLVAGIIAARRNNGIGIAGINPGARIMVLKVTNRFGQTNSLAIFRAIHYAVEHGARVINLSLGGEGVSRLEQLAINFAHARGAVVVVAAGNASGDVAQFGPAAARRAIAVGGLDMDRKHTKLSNEGAALALSAPGQNIYSLQSKDAEWPGPAAQRERHYRTATGTSFAAPIVAATASLILAKQPDLPNVLVEDMILNSVHPLGDASWNSSTGWGLLNAAEALSFPPEKLITLWPNEVVVDKKEGSVRVYGTIRGVFSSYHLDVGKGKQPREWQPAGGPMTRPVTQGLLGEVSGPALKGMKDAVIRLTAQATDGTAKVAYVSVSLK